VKFVGKGQDLEKKVQQLNKDVSHIQTFSIRKSTDQQLFLIFTDGQTLGYLSEKLADAFEDLIDQPSVEFDAIVDLYTLGEAIRRAEKPSDAAMRVNINIYGPASRQNWREAFG
jgi:SWI/SNF-related matrix-associated actin-dependent regulator of chromatin subfamily A3